MQQPVVKPHRSAWQICLNKSLPVLGLLVIQILARLLAFAPFILAVATGSFLSFDPEHAPAYGLVFSLPLYALIVMPLRFQAKARMAGLHGLPHDSRLSARNCFKWLAAALVRLMLVLPAMLPLFAFCYFFYYYMRVPGFNESLLFIQRIGELVKGSYPEGILIILLAALISSGLAAWAWLRGLPFEHQDVIGQGIGLSLKKANQRMISQRKSLKKTVRINFLLFLPALLGVLAMLVIQVMSMPLAGTLVFDFLIAVSVFLTLSFPDGTLFILIVVLLVLWLPLLPVRKLALNFLLSETPGENSAA